MARQSRESKAYRKTLDRIKRIERRIEKKIESKGTASPKDKADLASAKNASAEILYKRYVREYRLRAIKMDRRGEKMDDEMYTKSSFFEQYESKKTDMKEFSANTGRRMPSSTDVIDFLVSDQQYEISLPQARALKMSIENRYDDVIADWPKNEEGERRALTPQNIRRGFFEEQTKETWKLVREAWENGRKAGWDWKKIQDEIDRNIFGSP